MSEDITFCFSECESMKCFRNKKHIKLQMPHSFADLEGTDYCIKERKRDNDEV